MPKPHCITRQLAQRRGMEYAGHEQPKFLECLCTIKWRVGICLLIRKSDLDEGTYQSLTLAHRSLRILTVTSKFDLMRSVSGGATAGCHIRSSFTAQLHVEITHVHAGSTGLSSTGGAAGPATMQVEIRFNLDHQSMRRVLAV